ncbi:MAG: hypothetical protein PHE50_00130 [Dehalococcoidales bacterium]|nr:hypothetical protein [Dehalococcoidales bacterium]
MIDKQKIEDATLKMHNARCKLEALSRMNVYGLLPEERLKIDIEYNLSKAEMIEAQRELDIAISFSVGELK